jgi:hypothetical protein
MGGTRGTYGKQVHRGKLWVKLMEGVHLEDVGVDERVILKRISKEKAKYVDRTGLVWNRDEWLLLETRY